MTTPPGPHPATPTPGPRWVEPIRKRLVAGITHLTTGGGGPSIDLSSPLGDPGLFGPDAVDLRCVRREFNFRYRSPQHWIDVFRSYYGPTHKAYSALEASRQEELSAAITGFWQSWIDAMSVWNPERIISTAWPTTKSGAPSGRTGGSGRTRRSAPVQKCRSPAPVSTTTERAPLSAAAMSAIGSITTARVRRLMA